MRARSASSSASGISIVNGRIAASSVVPDIWILLASAFPDD
jgi:hypothetical protein